MMGDITNNTYNIADYLAQLLKDKKQLTNLPSVFMHVERLLDGEITKVRGNLFHLNDKMVEPLVLPDGIGAVVTLSEKVYVPTKEFPDFNFVGRILGPRGMTTKQLEQETGCKIMVRGKGSMRDKKKEDMNRGKPNWEHLADDLHVLITCEDSDNRSRIRMNKAIEEVKKLITVCDSGEDELKKRQLMELAIMNGTYRDSQTRTHSPGLESSSSQHARALANSQVAAIQSAMISHQNLMAFRSSVAAPLGGAPLILSPRMQGYPAGQLLGNPAMNMPSIMTAAGAPPPLVPAGDSQCLLYAQYAAALAAGGGDIGYANAATNGGYGGLMGSTGEYGGLESVSAVGQSATTSSSSSLRKMRHPESVGQTGPCGSTSSSVRHHPYARSN